MLIEDFHIKIARAEQSELKEKLAAARFAEPVAGYGPDQGIEPDRLREIVRYWERDYDWPAREALLNRLPHFRAAIGDMNLHFIHARSNSRKGMPLLLMNGWPSSFVQFQDIIPMLTNESEDGGPVFDVVAPSMPGYPFTDIPTAAGMNFTRIGDLMVELMTGLGYERFAIRGSDQGGIVMQQIALKYPDKVIGLHRSGIFPFLPVMPADLSQEEAEYQKNVAAWARSETAYATLQAFRPETIVNMLADSPVALASWFLDKFERWGDKTIALEAGFGLDRLLDNLSLHWFARTGAASVRLYYEAVFGQTLQGRPAAPAAILMPLNDRVTLPAPRAWCDRFFNVERFTMLEKGGHFPEWEVPELVANDMRQFFGGL